MSLSRLMCLGVLMVTSAIASASTMNYTESFTASGKVGSTSFKNSAVSITLTADPNGVSNDGYGDYTVDTSQVTISIGGTTYVLLSAGLDAEVINTIYPTDGVAGIALFQDIPNGATDLFEIGTSSSALKAYDLRSAIGPITGTRDGYVNIGSSFNTTSGTKISFSSTTGSTTFTASPVVAAVPEPGSLSLLSIGSLGLVRLLRRYRHRSLS
ncbi:hypothetical protein BH10ACI4_BH10ACI4_28480 [soil metagenome]